jgi:SRSO17 transposase
VDIQELRRLRPALDRFVTRFDDCISTAPSRRHLRTYINGQLGPLERKSIEPIALDAGVHPRNLQEFLSIHRWDDRAMGRRLREIVRREHPDENAIAVIDETSFPKKGTKTPGVQRQHCGATGKTDNCVVTVHLGYITKDFHALIDGDLYLPEEAWSNDRGRCRAAGIPDDVVYRAKWKIALEVLGRSVTEGISMRWLTADEGYGRVGDFRRTVSDLGLTYVVEIPSSITGWTKPRLDAGETKARPVSKLWHRGGPRWTKYQIKLTDKGPIVWEVRETRFFPRSDGDPGKEERLLILKDVLSGEVKYFLSNASAEVPLKTLLLVAFSRWHIERLFEDGKGEVGFDHFEVRCYRSLMRHLVLTNLSLLFLCEQTNRLRGGKSILDGLPGEGCSGGPTGSNDFEERADSSAEESPFLDLPLAGAERRGGFLS